MSVHIESKSAVSVCEMARLVGLSRSRFYELVEAGVFPSPIYDLVTRRPHYSEEMRDECLQVRRTNSGKNGRCVLFYTPRRSEPARAGAIKKPSNKKSSANHHDDLLDGLRALGLASVTAAQVHAACQQVFPRGTDGRDSGEVLRMVFLRLKGQGSAA
jgi:hypothetical protein